MKTFIKTTLMASLLVLTSCAHNSCYHHCCKDSGNTEQCKMSQEQCNMKKEQCNMKKEEKPATEAVKK